MSRADILLQFFEAVDPNIIDSELTDALYAVGETGLFPDKVDSVSVDQAIFCWKIVEKLTKRNFPNELRM